MYMTRRRRKKDKFAPTYTPDEMKRMKLKMRKRINKHIVVHMPLIIDEDVLDIPSPIKPEKVKVIRYDENGFIYRWNETDEYPYICENILVKSLGSSIILNLKSKK